ncbi:MAG TPA: hypothetical protein VLN48_01420 [Bryobacteraceae bacterium]|nr:hypothetical protein [Bryobacteraceae bacterium]
MTALTAASAAGAYSGSGWTGFGWLAAVAGPYVAANVAASLHAAWKERRASLALRMPLIFASLHLAYGAGSLWGCARLAFTLARQTAIETGRAA